MPISVINRKFTEEESCQYEKNLSQTQEFLDKTTKSKRLDIMKLCDIMNIRD